MLLRQTELAYLPDTAGIEFWGAGPQGEILAQASHDKEEILIAEVDLDLQENVRQNWPFLETEELMLWRHY
jgi:N-carbamoylputrescine amidase